jgi:probable phosphomutase (TIGR03848 family)
MATVILVRHGRSTANAAGILAGRAEGIGLDEVGRAQAARTADRLGAVPLASLISSPLQRCRDTARMIVAGQNGEVPTSVDEAITECDYGTWQGRPIAELVREPLWATVQSRPSEAVFPGGESLAIMQQRAVAAIRRHDSEHDPASVWVAVSHGDIIKSVLADALGMHLDSFQRIHVAPASVSIVRYTSDGPHVLTVNSETGDLAALVD